MHSIQVKKVDVIKGQKRHRTTTTGASREDPRFFEEIEKDTMKKIVCQCGTLREYTI